MSLKSLSAFLSSNPAARRLYKKFLCMPLMRSDKINAAFECFTVEANKFGEHFHSFLEYFKTQWIQNEGAKSISLFLQSHRTNNPSESYNSDLNSKVQKHGCMYKFLEVIQREEFLKSREFHITKEGGTQMYPEQRSKFVEREVFITTVQTEFENGKLTLIEFFDKIINYTKLDEYIDGIVSDDDSTSSDEDNQLTFETELQELRDASLRQACSICKTRPRDTFLKPCSHVNFCFQCIESLHKPARKRNTISPIVKCPLPSCGKEIETYHIVHY